MMTCYSAPSQPIVQNADTFDADVQYSEMLRQGDVKAVQLETGYGEAWGWERFDEFNAGVQAAQAAHFRRCLASALANGHDAGNWLSALKSIGATP